MRWLSQRLVCLACIAGGAPLLCHALPAAAQIPIYAPADSAADVTPTVELAPSPEPKPLAPPAPSSETRGPSLSAPAAAKTDVISEPRPRVEPPPADDTDDDDEDAVNVSSRTRPTWYGWQTLIMDGATLSIFVSAATASSADDGLGAKLGGLGAASYELGPGIIHFVHGNPGRGLASFGIRVGLPLAGAFIGASAASGCDGFRCEVGGAVVGALLGAGGAIAIDAAVFAYDDPKRISPSHVALRPLLSLTPGRAFVGLAGQL
jgi:hypothetical protein